MPKYQMPDGNTYDFSSDQEATEAMSAWDKQFGQKETTGPVIQGLKDFGRSAAGLATGIADFVGDAPQYLASLPVAIGAGVGTGDYKGALDWLKQGGMSVGNVSSALASQGMDTYDDTIGKKVVHYPFEKLTEAIDWTAEKIGGKGQLGASTNLALQGALLAGIPGARPVVKGTKKVLDRFVPAADLRKEAGYGKVPDNILAEAEALSKNDRSNFTFNQETGRLERGNEYIDPLTNEVRSVTEGRQYPAGDRLASSRLPQLPEQGIRTPEVKNEVLPQDPVLPFDTPPAPAQGLGPRGPYPEIVGTDRGITPAQKEGPLPGPMTSRDAQVQRGFDEFGSAIENMLAGRQPKNVPVEEVLPSIPGVEIAKEPLIDPVSGKQLAGLNQAGRSQVNLAAAKALWERLVPNTKSKFKDFDEFFDFIMLHERKHNEARYDATKPGADVLGIEREINNNLMVDEIPRRREAMETIPMDVYVRDILGTPAHPGELPPVTSYARDGIPSERQPTRIPDQPTLSRKQAVSQREKYIRDLEKIVEKIKAYEEGLTPSGTVDIAKLERSRKYLENAIDKLPMTGGTGKKGKSQGGAVNFGFSEFVVDQAAKIKEKISKEDFAAELQKLYPTLSEDNINKLYEKHYGPIEVKNAVDTAISRIPGLKETISPELQPLEVMVERWKNETDIGDGVVSKALRENLSSGGRMTAERTGNSFIDWNVENILGETRKAQVVVKNLTNDLKGEVNKLVGTNILNKFKDKFVGEQKFIEAVTELIRTQDTNQKPNVSREAQPFVNKLRTAMDDLGLKIQAELASQGVNFKWRTNYLAHSFFGPYRVLAKDSTGKVLGVISGRTKDELVKGMEHVKGQMSDLIFTPPEYNKAFESTSGELGKRYGAFNDILNSIKSDSPLADSFHKTLADFYNQTQQNYMGYRKHMKTMKGVFGYEGARPWDNAKNNAYDMLEAQLAIFDHGYQWLAEQKIKKDLEKVLTNTSINMPEAKAYVTTYLDHAFGRTNDYLSMVDSVITNTASALGIAPSSAKEILAIARNFALTNSLGLSGGFMLTQAIQVPQALSVAFAKASGEGISGNRFSSGLLGTMDMYHAIAGKFENMSNEGKYFFNYFKKSGVMDPHLIEHTIHRKIVPTTGMSPIRKAIWGSVNTLFKGMELESNLIGKLSIEYPEAGTRGTFAMTLAHYYHSAGMSLKEAAVKADKDTSVLFVDYTPQERAMIFARMGELGKFASTVSTFKMNNLNQYVTFTNKKMYGTLATLGLAAWATTGIFGMPGGDELEYLATTAKANGIDIDTPREWLLKNAPPVVTFGPLSYAATPFGGPDMAVHRKFSMSNLVPDDVLSFLYPLLSFYTKKVELGTKAIKNPTDENIGAFAREMVPGNLKYAVDYGMLTDEKGRTHNPNTFDNINRPGYTRSKNEWKLAAILGIPSNKEFLGKQMTQMDKMSEAAWKKNTTRMINNTLAAWRDKDQEKFKQLYTKSLQYNPDASKEIATKLQQQAISMNMDMDTFTRMNFAKRATNQHGAGRLQDLMQMQRNQQ